MTQAPPRRAAVLVTTLIVVAHGCHADDVDHEPAAADTRRP